MATMNSLTNIKSVNTSELHKIGITSKVTRHIYKIPTPMFFKYIILKKRKKWKQKSLYDSLLTFDCQLHLARPLQLLQFLEHGVEFEWTQTDLEEMTIYHWEPYPSSRISFLQAELDYQAVHTNNILSVIRYNIYYALIDFRNC